jgi:hypothetical protein
MTEDDAFDFAIVVYREDECWDAEMLPVALTSDLQGLIKALRQQPSESGTIGLVALSWPSQWSCCPPPPGTH